MISITVTYVRVNPDLVGLEIGVKSAVAFAVAQTKIDGRDFLATATAHDPENVCVVENGHVGSMGNLPTGVIVTDHEHDEEMAIKDLAICTAIGRLVKMLSRALKSDPASPMGRVPILPLEFEYVPRRDGGGRRLPLQLPKWLVTDDYLGETVRRDSKDFGVSLIFRDQDVQMGFEGKLQKP